MAEEQQKTEDIADQPELVPWIDFLQERPPGSIVQVSGAIKQYQRSYSSEKYFGIFAPEIQLHCPEQTCNAYMFFQNKDDNIELVNDQWKFTFLRYWCRNCGKYSKTFSLAVKFIHIDLSEAYKFGELPHF